MQRQLKYKCGCGCINTPDQMIIIRIAGTKKNINRKRCIKHTDLGNVVSRIITCDECGKKVEFKPKGGIPTTCTECSRPLLLKKMSDRAKKYYNNGSQKNIIKRNGHLADPDRWDCAKRSACLDKYDGYDALPCLGCDNYSPYLPNDIHDRRRVRYGLR